MPEKSMTEEEVRKLVVEHPEITTRTLLRAISNKAYLAAIRFDILDELFGELVSWTPEAIREYLVKHPEIKTRKQLKTLKYGAYRAAFKFNMLGDLFGESLRKSWTEDEVYKIVEENPDINTRNKLKQKEIRAYHAAKRLGILDDLFSDKFPSKWTPDAIRQYLKEHPEIKTRTYFLKSLSTAYMRARELGMLEEFFGETLKKTWTPQMIREYLKEHPDIKTRNDLFEKCHKIYMWALRYDMMDELFGKRKFWSKEECGLLAQLCFSRNQFFELYPNAYNAACKHGWLDEICSHMNRLIDFYIVEEYIIYVYEDEINHCAYVGLTNNKKRRDYEHLMNKADSLYKYCRKYDIPVPEMKVLIENLSASEAQKEEKRMWYKYRDEGWTMINSEKSLGYLGTSAKYLKKVKLQITKILEEHPEIKTKELLKIISEDAYDLVRRLNMFKEFFK